MSYLASPASTTEYGVVEIGSFINVLDGVISIPQNVDPTAEVNFLSVTALEGTFTGNINTSYVIANTVTSNIGDFTEYLYANGNLVVTSVTPSAGVGIELDNVITNGYETSFLIKNIGVTYLNAGTGISLSSNIGNITISSFGADLINVIGVTTNYTAANTDEYIGVGSASAVTITLPAGIVGRIYTIKDEFGQGSGKITIQPQTGELIDGKASYVISIPYQSVSCVFRAGKWWLI